MFTDVWCLSYLDLGHVQRIIGYEIGQDQGQGGALDAQNHLRTDEEKLVQGSPGAKVESRPGSDQQNGGGTIEAISH
jgi:hypothetical protein